MRVGIPSGFRAVKRQGLVVARHRRHVLVEDNDGTRHLCKPGRRGIEPLVADDVIWRAEADGSGVIEKVLERRTTLTRIDSRGRRELVAANPTRLIAVAAVEPPPDWLVVDRYLVAGELAKMSAVVVLNKCDLGAERPRHIECYRRAGYAVHLVSTKTSEGLDDLAAELVGERSVMVGQSGVGKSSLLNALLGESVQATGELTGKGGQGRHTTSNMTLHRLPKGGELIDSPGVRSYSPYIEDATDLQHGFREIRAHLGQCRFDNCRHAAEPGCAVKLAVDAGRVCRRRHESYLRLLEQTESFAAARW